MISLRFLLKMRILKQRMFPCTKLLFFLLKTYFQTLKNQRFFYCYKSIRVKPTPQRFAYSYSQLRNHHSRERLGGKDVDLG